MIKFISAEFDGHTSRVKVEKSGLIYTGLAWVHPDDKGYESELTGCTLAEIRATVAALKADLRKEKELFRQYNHFVQKCTEYKKFNAEDPSAKVMFRQLNRQKKKVEDLKNEINFLKGQIDTIVTYRSKYVEKRKATNESKEVNE